MRGTTGWCAATIASAAIIALVPRLMGVAIAIVVALAMWQWPGTTLRLAVFAILAVRPALDMFSERRLGLSAFAASPAAVFAAGITLAAVVLGIRRGRVGGKIWPDGRLLPPHLWLMFAYALAYMSGVRLYGGIGAVVGLREVTREASVIGAFLLMVWWIKDGHGSYASGWAALALGAVAPVFMAIWQLVTVSGNLEIAGINRLQGTFSHPHTLGPYLVPFILFLIGGMASGRAVQRVVRLVTAAALSVLLALTYSRTALLVLVAGLGLLPLLHARRLGRGAFVRGVALVLLFAGASWFLAGGLIRERFAGLRLGSEALEAAREGTTENSLEWRLMNWGGLLALSADHPWEGHGLGMTVVLNPLSDPSTGIPYTAHNDFVRIVFEGGVVGLGCYVIYGVLLCAWALRKARGAVLRHGPGAFAVVAALIALLFLTGGAMEFGTQTVIQYELYSMLALLTAVQAADVGSQVRDATGPEVTFRAPHW